MPIRVDAYTAEGIASGQLDRPTGLRDLLEASGELPLTKATWQAMGQPTSAATGAFSLPIDDLLVVISNDDPTTAIHAAWHRIRLEVGPYVLTGELPTLPGFDPGRALTRPSGEFILVKGVTLAFLAVPDVTIDADHALVNRYGVDRVEADLSLGFFFPGAAIETSSATTSVESALPTA